VSRPEKSFGCPISRLFFPYFYQWLDRMLQGADQEVSALQWDARVTVE
jgi:hypothetical protein